MKKKRILLVDDEPDLASVCKMILEDEGYRVDGFTDPILALSKYKPNYYDLVILDIKMPEMDGFDLYMQIKKLDNDVKACFLTASEMYYENFRSEEYSSIDVDLFIHKPIENDELLKKIEKIVGL